MDPKFLGNEYKTVTITKSVPVADKESLKAWLNQELEGWLKDKRDAGSSKATAGSKALDLIEEAGFKLQPPTIKR